MRETWYVLEDGSMADPKEILLKDGKLVHKDGVAVKMRSPDVPLTSGVDVDEDGKDKAAKAKAKTAEPKGREVDAQQPAASAKNREMKAKGGKGYKTR